MRNILNLCWRLLVIALVAGLALGVVHAVTEQPIAKQALAAAEEARKTVLPQAAAFEPNADETVYVGRDAAGAVVGFVTSGETKGFGGVIEVTVGLSVDGTITGISVGGSGFKETAGLGAKTKDAAFTDQFIGKSDELTAVKHGTASTDQQIDAVSGATISSRAVTNEVNALTAILTAFQADYAGGK